MKLKAAILFVIFLMLGLSACSTETPIESTAATAPDISAEALYDEACAKLNAAPNRILSYQYDEKRQIGSDTYTKNITGSDSYCGIGTDRMQAVIRQSLHYGTYQTEYAESFVENAGYSSVNGSCFTAAMDADTFLARQLPAVLLDRTLYGSIHAQANEETVLLTFSEPSAIEAWAIPYKTVQLISASATALLDTSGNLLEYHYEAAYTCGNTIYQLTVTSKLTTPQHLDLSAMHPQYPEAPIALKHLNAPKLILQAVGDLFTAQSISAQISQSLTSKVYSLTYNLQSNLHLEGSGDQLVALCDTTLSTSDYRGDPVVNTQTDRYENGTLTRTVNGTLQFAKAKLPEQIRVAWENQILNSFFALNYLADADVIDTGSTLVLRLSGNEAFCNAVSSGFRSALPNDLDAIADSFETGAAGGYLTIEKETGLPIAMGMQFERTHSIDGIAYPLSFSLTQILKLSDAGTHDALHP